METTFVVAVLCFFSFCSVLNQFETNFKTTLSKLDILDLLPNWKFFAPVPGTQDFRIVYQDLVDDNFDSPWIECDVIQSGRKTWDFLWNPRKHFQKACIDVIQILLLDSANIRHSSPDQDKVKLLLQLTWSYCTVLKIAMSIERKHQKAVYRRFAILKSHGFSETMDIQPMFISYRHKF